MQAGSNLVAVRRRQKPIFQCVLVYTTLGNKTFMTIKNLFSELLSLTELYIFQEHQTKDWILAEPESHLFFKNFAKKFQKQPPQKFALTKSSQEQPALTTVYQKKSKIVSDKPKEEKSVGSTIKSQDVFKPKSLVNGQDVAPDLLTIGREHCPSDDDIKQLVKKYPQIHWRDTLPSDHHAKASSWKEVKNNCDILFISDRNLREQHAFLIKIALAIKKYGKSVIVIESPDLSIHPDPKIIIASKTLFSNYPEIKQLWGTKSHLIEIENITEMMKNQNLKRSLWNQITQTLSL